MIKLIYVFLILTSVIFAQTSATQQSPESRCVLPIDEYDVFAAVIKGVHKPDPWLAARLTAQQMSQLFRDPYKGKDMLVLDVTATSTGPTGERLTPIASEFLPHQAPSKETISNYNFNSHAACPLQLEFSDGSYTVISHDELEAFFKRGIDGWKDFYSKYPNSAGFWQFSRPGFNSTRDEAILYVVHSCGGLCGTGSFYVLSKRNGEWTIKSQVQLWIS